MRKSQKLEVAKKKNVFRCSLEQRWIHQARPAHSHCLVCPTVISWWAEPSAFTSVLTHISRVLHPCLQQSVTHIGQSGTGERER